MTECTTVPNDKACVECGKVHQPHCESGPEYPDLKDQAAEAMKGIDL